MGELRAAIAVARKDIRSFSRYRIAVAGTVFTPLYQFIIPAFLFGAAFAVNGRQAGLSATLGTEDLPGFIFLGASSVVSSRSRSGGSRSHCGTRWTWAPLSPRG